MQRKIEPHIMLKENSTAGPMPTGETESTPHPIQNTASDLSRHRLQIKQQEEVGESATKPIH